MEPERHHQCTRCAARRGHPASPIRSKVSPHRREEGFQTTDGAVGVLATGTVNIATVNTLITAMPEGTFELVSHPGYRDEHLARANTRLLESREIERNALMAIKDFRGVDLISFACLGHSVESKTAG